MKTCKEIRQQFGMNQTQFARYFEIPLRSVQNWEGGQRKCPEYLLKLMEYKLINERRNMNMKKTFTIANVKYTVVACTAVASCDMETADRQEALLVVGCMNGEKIEQVVFGYEMPETAEDFAAMCEDSSAWESDWEVIESVEVY